MARGNTPGSLKLVRSSVDITKIKFKTAITGMAGVNSVAKKGQLKMKERIVRDMVRQHKSKRQSTLINLH